MAAGRNVQTEHSKSKISETQSEGSIDLCIAHREKQPMAEQT